PGPLIKWGIEKYGTQAVGAKVDVGSVDFSWLSARLAIEDLAVTDPQKPMFNMLALNNIATEVNVGELIAGEVYLNEVAIEGIALDIPRSSSGAVPGLAGSSLFGEDEGGFSIPGVELPDTQTLVEQEKAVYEQKIKDVQSAIDAKEKEWKALQESLPDKAKLEEYKARLKELKKNKDPLARIAALNDLKQLSKDIKKDLKAFDKAKKQIKSDFQGLKTDIANLKSLPDKSFAEIVTTLGLEDSKLASLGANMLEGPMRVWIEKGFNYYKLMSGGEATSSQESNDVTPQTAPNLFIELTKLSGPFTQGDQKGEILGTIKNFSDAPALAGKPMLIDLKAMGGQLGEISLAGTIDHLEPGKEKDLLAFKMVETALDNFQLSQSESLDLLLKKALVNLDAQASITSLESLDINFNSVFKSLDLEAGGEGESQQAIVSALTQLSELIVKGTADGTISDPSLRLKSNLDDVLKTALGSVIKEKTNAFKAELTEKLNAQLTEKLGPLDAKLQDAMGITKQLDEQSAEFKDFNKSVKK
ncbi:MAG: TIGR03545 family protein, partial [Pseudomonadales bacterium]|nr:TIGR03545 family protein [Pseudomonadales bacterium]